MPPLTTPLCYSFLLLSTDDYHVIMTALCPDGTLLELLGVEKKMARMKLSNVVGLMSRSEWLITGGAIVLSAVAGVLTAIHAHPVITFVFSGSALAILAALVGIGTEQIGSRLGPGATGVLQSSLGNLPELFVGYFALRNGLIPVLQAALVGSVLGNSLFVLGLAFLVGGLRHGTQRFAAEVPRMIATLTLLAVAALIVPTLVFFLHTPAAWTRGRAEYHLRRNFANYLYHQYSGLFAGWSDKHSRRS